MNTPAAAATLQPVSRPPTKLERPLAIVETSQPKPTGPVTYSVPSGVDVWPRWR